MNLKTHIRPELWLAVSNTYEAENYSHAILDAMHYLSNVLREKAGVDGDGVGLVGQALGGSSPRLRVNKLQTETERNVQKGLEQTLRGLYQGIRNPRSHEQIEDTKDTADAIIFFVNYLLGILDQSEEPFTIPKFLSRVFDPDFVESDRYAQLLAAEIPANKRIDTLIEIYRKKCDGDGEKLKYMVNAILQQLSYDQIADFVAVVSDELKTTQDSTAIRVMLQIVPPHLWPSIDESARLRVESKLIKSIREGEMNRDKPNEIISGALGTWSRDFLQFFTLRDEVSQVLIGKLGSRNIYVRRYVADFFMSVLPVVIIDKTRRRRCIKAMSKAVRVEDTVMKCRLADCLADYPEVWRNEIVKELEDITDPDNPGFYLPDGTPVLSTWEIPF